MIVCLTPPQINDFCDLLGTPYAPVSKIAPVKGNFSTETTVAFLIPQTDEPNHFHWLEILKLTYKND